MTLPRTRLLPGLRHLRSLTLYNDSVPSEHLLKTTYLRSLDLNLERVRSDLDLRNTSIDLSDFTFLEHLAIQGTIWSDLQETFTGSSSTIKTCTLRGPLVLGKRSEAFFSRIATGLQSLYCYGVHLIGRLDTVFPKLTFLALHKTIYAIGVFPFPRSELRTVSVEVERCYTARSSDEASDVIEFVLQNTRRTLEFLVLRSEITFVPDSLIFKNICAMTHPSILVLDGSPVLHELWSKSLPSLDQFASDPCLRGEVSWYLAMLELELISYFQGNTSTFTYYVPNASLCHGVLPPNIASQVQKYRCLENKSISRQLDMNEGCFNTYTWLLGDHRTRSYNC